MGCSAHITSSITLEEKPVISLERPNIYRQTNWLTHGVCQYFCTWSDAQFCSLVDMVSVAVDTEHTIWSLTGIFININCSSAFLRHLAHMQSSFFLLRRL